MYVCLPIIEKSQVFFSFQQQRLKMNVCRKSVYSQMDLLACCTSIHACVCMDLLHHLLLCVTDSLAE